MDQRSSRMTKDRVMRELIRLQPSPQPLPPGRLKIRPRGRSGQRLSQLQRDWLLSLPLPGAPVLALWLAAAEISTELSERLWTWWLTQSVVQPPPKRR